MRSVPAGGLRQRVPHAKVGRADVPSTWAGVRPVVSEGERSGKKPSDEARTPLWVRPGCVTLAGGKLYRFRLLAWKYCAPVRRCSGRDVANVEARHYSCRIKVALRPEPEPTAPGRSPWPRAARLAEEN